MFLYILAFLAFLSDIKGAFLLEDATFLPAETPFQIKIKN
jgi:hypothetical protein